MSTNAIDAQGTKIYVSPSGSPQSYSAIPEIKTLAGPTGKIGLNDVSDLDSTAHEFKPQLPDNGDVTLGIFYIPSNAVHASLRSAFANRTLKGFRLVFTNDSAATKWDFNGYVVGFNTDMPVDSEVTAQVTIKITGAITEGV